MLPWGTIYTHILVVSIVRACIFNTDFFLCRIYAGFLILISLSVAAHSAANVDQRMSLLNMLLARLQNQNGFDQPHHAQCTGPDGMYRVRSVHDNHHEDRSWTWECRQVITSGYPKCHTTGWVNNFDQPMSFTCGPNEYIAGTESYHNNHYEDRRWKFTCCSAPDYKASGCRITDYVNDFDAPISFTAGPGETITGVFSYHNNRAE